MGTLETIKLIVSSGELALLAAVLLGLFRLAASWLPQLLAALGAFTSELAGLRAEVRSLASDVRDTRSRASAAAEDVAEMRGAYSTGQHQAATAERPFPSNPDRRR